MVSKKHKNFSGQMRNSGRYILLNSRNGNDHNQRLKYVRLFLKIILFALVNLITVSNSSAKDQYGLWRYWSENDGLAENYIRTISLTSDNSLWIRHGDVDRLSYYDGNVIKKIPYPKNIIQVNASTDGQAWTQNNEGFYKYVDGDWILYRLKIDETNYETLTETGEFHPFNDNSIAYLDNGDLKVFNQKKSKAHIIKSFANSKIGRYLFLIGARDNSVWIVGDAGIARFTLEMNNMSLASWEDYPFPNDSWHSPHGCILGKDNEIYFIVYNTLDGLYHSIQFDGNDWQTLHCGEQIRFGWTDYEDRIWINDGYSLFIYFDEKKYPIELDEVLVGRFHKIAIESNGSFWIATNQGLARFTKNLFDANKTSMPLSNRIHNVFESMDRKLYCAAGNFIIQFDGKTWKQFPLPDGLETNHYHSEALSLLSNGKIAFDTRNNVTDEETGTHFLLFDQVTGTFEQITHPEQREIRVIASAPDFNAFVISGTFIDFKIEIFDGTNYELISDQGDQWNIGSPRYPFQTTCGDYWIGGTEGIGYIGKKGYRFFTPDDGYTGHGVFSIFEKTDGSILAGGRSNLFQYDGERWSVILEETGIIREIIETSNGEIWAASNKGLYRHFNESWLRYDNRDGLPGNNIYEIFEDSSKRIWIATSQGLCFFNPSSDYEFPQSQLTNELNKRAFSFDENLVFFLSGIDKWNFTTPNRLLFSHRLNGTKWSPFSRKQVVNLPSVPPGDYRLDVRTMDQRGNIEKGYSSWEFTVNTIPLQQRPLFIPITAAILSIIVLLSIYTLWAKRKLALYANNLETIVDERTKKLQEANIQLQNDMIEREALQEQIRQSQKMEAIGTLAGGVAHDFNNIIMAIMGYSKMTLCDLHDNETATNNIQQIQKAADRAASLTQQLLAFSRKQMIQPQIIDVNNIVRETQNMLSRLLGEDITIEFLSDPTLKKIYADPGQIDQIVMNIAINARDAMPTGGKFIIESSNKIVTDDFATHKGKAAPGEYVTLCFSDTGKGMTKETIEKIFEPFFTTKEKSKGTGLGLATVYGIVRQNKGYITVYSELDKGTTFKLYFPAVDGKIAEHSSDTELVSSFKGKESVLVVEDEEMVRQYLVRTLLEYGYTVFSAHNYQEALRIFNERNKQFDMLITDVVLPERSGKEIAETLQKENPKLEVIYMSGYTDNAIIQHNIIDEGVHFLQKPFMPDTILKKMRQVLDSE